MSVTTRAQMIKQLVPGLNALFGLEYKRYPPHHADIYNTKSSKRSFEEMTKRSGFELAPVKPEGQGVEFDVMQEAWTARWVHETIALAFAVTEEATEDNLYVSVGNDGVTALARALAETKQTKAAALLNNGFTTARGGDGVTIFSTAHPLMNGGMNSNRAGTPADLAEASLEAAIISVARWTDERGLLINARPVSLHIAPEEEFAAERLTESELRPGSPNNDINAIRSTRRLPGGYKQNPYFTDPDAWFLKMDIPDAFIHFERVKLQRGNHGDFTTGNLLYKARERYSFGVKDPLGFWGNAGA